MSRTRRPKDVPATLRKDGRLVAVVGWVDDLDVARRTYVYGRTQEEVNEKYAAVMKRLNDGHTATDARVKLATFSTGWIKSTLAASNRKANTRVLYAGIVRSHIVGSDLGAMTLRAIRPAHIEAWIQGLRAKELSRSTVRQIYTVLRAILDTAVRDELLTKNPAHAVTRPTIAASEAKFLEPTQIKKLLTAASGSRYALVFTLLVNTGLRRGEALALRWNDIDFKAGTLRVNKTMTRIDGKLIATEPKTEKSRRTVPLSAKSVQVLRDARQRQLRERLQAGSQWHDTPFVFTTEFGEPSDPRNALRAFKVAAKSAGFDDIGLHTLRHSAATAMLVNGVPLKVVSEILGHFSISITADIYGHVSPEVSRDAMDKLSAALG